ncbi:hypothetical protein N7535_007456 [Penicillium sp. DV-2018c]|nr:hypothetical protein N7461_003484 [Penicillium sp. DV-2018c]KAJ5565818.1 hypothetical protein N7535_007456 [Penicillium sp. DV-2018c]
MSNGINNPSGIFFTATGPLYLIFAPVTSAITAPNGIVQNAISTVLTLVGGDITSDRAIPALALLYGFWAFAGSGALSVAGQAMARATGYDNDHPRKHRAALDGLPLRLVSAHNSLLEIFPLFAATACLAQVIAPGDQQIRNLVGLHVLAKTFAFYPSYLAGIPPLRSMSHVISVSALLRTLWLLTI